MRQEMLDETPHPYPGAKDRLRADMVQLDELLDFATACRLGGQICTRPHPEGTLLAQALRAGLVEPDETDADTPGPLGWRWRSGRIVIAAGRVDTACILRAALQGITENAVRRHNGRLNDDVQRFYIEGLQEWSLTLARMLSDV